MPWKLSFFSNFVSISLFFKKIVLFWVPLPPPPLHPHKLIHLLCPVVQNVVRIYLTSAFYVSHYAKCISIHRSIITTILQPGRARMCPEPSAGRRWGWKLVPGLPAAKPNTLPCVGCFVTGLVLSLALRSDDYSWRWICNTPWIQMLGQFSSSEFFRSFLTCFVNSCTVVPPLTCFGHPWNTTY